MDSKEIEKFTRKIFHEIQSGQGNDQSIYDRLISLYSYEYFHVDEHFFNNKICLDAGCGNNVHGTKALLNLGAKKVHALDLDETIFDTAPKFLKGSEGRYELKIGSVLDIPYDDDFFDFVLCSGVLHHTTDLFKGLSELSRVTKHGGILYLGMFGAATGIFSQITNLFRNEYVKNPNFHSLIDNLTEQKIMESLSLIYAELQKHNDPIINKIPFDIITSLINNDLILTIKDRITPPIYQNTPMDEIVSWLENNGFTDIERLKRYPKINNVRGFLSPLYYNHESELSKILLGEGFLQIKASKK
jgi:ubiquinone/menaquinone biosynthesis C-methylase UbiE|tara:strand:+ start:244 stop:1149 length:906 start_codon:yes stop_codon:yes gene_type:complete